MKPEVSIIIPVYNKLEWTKKCIESIWDYSRYYDYEIIVVANGCTDDTVEWVKSSLHLCLRVFKKPLGYGKAVNAGIKVALGKYFILLNNDTLILGETWIRQLIQPFDDPKVGITGPLMSWSPDVKSQFLIFFCVCIPRWMPSKIGLLDGKTFKEGYGEDIDYCMRIMKAGYTLMPVPNSPLKQESGTNVGTFPIFHEAEITVHDKNLVPSWGKIVERNRKILRDRYLR